MTVSARKMTESEIEETILQYLASSGWFCWKNNTQGFHDGKKWRPHASKWAINGGSDIIAIKDSRVIFVEVKTPIGKQSDSQKLFEDKLTMFGGEYFLVRSVDEIKNLLSV